MGFQAYNLWWGERKKRFSPHEGVDYVEYLDRKGKSRNLVSGMAVPSFFSGEITRFHRDFLAWTLYIRHPQYVMSDHVLYTVFGHLQPREKVDVGQQVVADEVIGFLENYRQDSAAPLHLHFTGAWVSESLSPEDLDWQLLNDSDQVILIDPQDDFPLC